MNKIILNELEYAEQCIRDGYVDSKPFFTLSILAKYYYHHLGYKPKQVKDELTEFMEKNCDLYKCNKPYWDERIKKLSQTVKRYKLYEIEGVWVTQA